MGILRGGTLQGGSLALQPKFPLVSTRLMFRVISSAAQELKIPAIIFRSEVGLEDDLIFRGRRRPVLLHCGGGGRGGRFQFLILDDGGGDRRVAEGRLGPRLAVASSLHLGGSSRDDVRVRRVGWEYRIATINMPLKVQREGGADVICSELP